MALCKTVNGTRPTAFAKPSPDESRDRFRQEGV